MRALRTLPPRSPATRTCGDGLTRHDCTVTGTDADAADRYVTSVDCADSVCCPLLNPVVGVHDQAPLSDAVAMHNEGVKDKHQMQVESVLLPGPRHDEAVGARPARARRRDSLSRGDAPRRFRPPWYGRWAHPPTS